MGDNMRLERLIAARAVAARQAEGLSAEAVASELGITVSHYQALEMGEIRFAPGLLAKLSKTLNIEIRNFFGAANATTGHAPDLLATLRRNTKLSALMFDIAIRDEAA